MSVLRDDLAPTSFSSFGMQRVDRLFTLDLSVRVLSKASLALDLSTLQDSSALRAPCANSLISKAANVWIEELVSFQLKLLRKAKNIWKRFLGSLVSSLDALLNHLLEALLGVLPLQFSTLNCCKSNSGSQIGGL